MCDFIIGFSASLLASFVFLFTILRLLRPSIKISPLIAKTIREGKTIYCFKVLNTSCYPAYNLQATLSQSVPFQVKNGTNMRNTVLTLRRDNIQGVEGKGFFTNNIGKNALIFTTYEDITEILASENKSVVFQITMHHGVSGISKTFSMVFDNINDLKDGNFIFGDNLGIS